MTKLTTTKAILVIPRIPNFHRTPWLCCIIHFVSNFLLLFFFIISYRISMNPFPPIFYSTVYTSFFYRKYIPFLLNYNTISSYHLDQFSWNDITFLLSYLISEHKLIRSILWPITFAQTIKIYSKNLSI